MTAFADALEEIFADPHLAEDGVWRAGGNGPAITLRIVRRSPDRVERFGDSRALLGGLTVDVLRAEAPSLAEGDTIGIGDTPFTVIAEAQADGFGTLLTVELAAS